MIRAFFVVACLGLATAPAWADSRAEAIVLFEQGQAEMKAGRYDVACQVFSQSLALYPDSGTKGSLARCFEKVGKLASAWLLWRELAATAPSSPLRADASKQAERLEPEVPKYILRVELPVPGMVVTVNGLRSGVSGVPVPVDVGQVVVVANAPGYSEWKASVAAEVGKTVPIDVPRLTFASPVEEVAPLPPPMPPLRDPGSGRRIVGLAITGLGVANLVGGTVFGLSARSKYADAKDVCGGTIAACDPNRVSESQDLVDIARRNANVSSILFAVGGAATIAGAVIWLTAPSASEGQLSLGGMVAPGVGGAVLSGRF